MSANIIVKHNNYQNNVPNLAFSSNLKESTIPLHCKNLLICV